MITGVGQMDSIDIKNQLTEIEHIFRRYNISEHLLQEIQKEMHIIATADDHSQLQMAIVGEFSSGKSSFINALLRNRLLSTDVLQGTTSAPTMIRYSEDIRVEVTFKNGEKQLYQEMIATWIERYTSIEEYAKTVKLVTIHHPANWIEKGITIIDTPGTNVLNQRHEEVTADIIEQHADGAIILIPANMPLAESLIKFIRSKLGNNITRSLFIVNKIDLLSIHERKRTIEYIHRRLKAEFALEEVTVLPYSSMMIERMEMQSTIHFQNLEVEGISEIYQLSRETEQSMKLFLNSLKNSVKWKNTKKWIRELQQQLRQHLEKLRETHEMIDRAFAKHLQVNIKKIANEFTTNEMTRFHQSYEKVTLQMQKHFKNCISSFVSFYETSIDSMQSEHQLHQLVHQQMDQYLTHFNQQLLPAIVKNIEQFTQVFNQMIQSFTAQFKVEYMKLATLGGMIAATNEIEELKLDNHADRMQKLTASLQLPSATDAQNMIAIHIGAGVTKPSLIESKTEYKQRIANLLTDLYNRRSTQMLQQFQQYVGELVEHYNRLTRSYREAYQHLANKMNGNHLQEKFRFEQLVMQMNKDISSLEQLCNKI
jgi:ribosome biogenesis GTPase A